MELIMIPLRKKQIMPFGSDLKISGVRNNKLNMFRNLVISLLALMAMCARAQTTRLIDERDGKAYAVVQVGSQTWMAENLAYAPGISTSADIVKRVREIFYAKPQDGSKFIELEKQYDKFIFCYNDDKSNCITYGALYTWEAALKSCPNGWHLPSKVEYDTLLSSFGHSRKDQYRALEAGGPSGLNCLAGGILLGFDTLVPGFEGQNRSGFYWTSTMSSKPGEVKKIQRMIFSKIFKKIVVNSNQERFPAAFSVRCIKD
jgi:uncharacterized protein (TIGR02145 family)